MLGLLQMPLKLLHISKDLPVCLAVSECCLKLLGSFGALVFVAGAELSGDWVTDGGEKVGSSLAWWCVETKVDEVLPGLVGRALIEHAPFIDDQDLVHQLINAFSGLIEGGDGCSIRYIGHDTQRFGVIQSGGCIETSCRIVPADDGALGGQGLGDGNSFSLTPETPRV